MADFGIYPNAGSNNRRRFNSSSPTPFDQPAPTSPRIAYNGNAPGPYGSEQPPAPRFNYPTPSFDQNQVDISNRRNDFSETLRQQRATTNAQRGGAISTPPAPTFIMGGGRSSGATLLPPGSNVAYPGAAGPAMPKPVRMSSEVQVPNKNYDTSSQSANWMSGLMTGKPQTPFITMRQQSLVDPTTGGPYQAPSTQPSAPTGPAPMSPQEIAHQNNQAYDRGERPPLPGAQPQSQIQLTEQQAREMWHNALRTHQGNVDLAADQFHGTMARYGQDGHGLLNQWTQDGSINNTQQISAPTSTPQIPMPLSMLGPSTTGSPLMPRQSYPGPSIAPPATVTPGVAGPFPGYTPLAQAAPPPQPMNLPDRTPATNAAMGAAMNYQGVETPQAPAQQPPQNRTAMSLPSNNITGQPLQNNQQYGTVTAPPTQSGPANPRIGGGIKKKTNVSAQASGPPPGAATATGANGEKYYHDAQSNAWKQY